MPRPIRLILCLALFASFAGPLPAAAADLPPIDTWRFNHPVSNLHVDGASDLTALFKAKSYTLPAVRDSGTVPRLFLHRLVGDMRSVTSIPDREALFIRTVLPLVVRANAEILAQRQTLRALRERRARGETLSSAESDWLEKLAKRYRGNPDDLTELLRRVDAVPASLSIAQAIDESGWGTAKLALRSNGMFGQHAPSSLGRGSLRAAGGNVSVAAFPSLLDGVLAYMTNINSHAAYGKLRTLRASHRKSGKPVSGLVLADGLLSYSQRGEVYVKTLKSLIRRHRLHAYDTTRPASGGAVLIRVAR